MPIGRFHKEKLRGQITLTERHNNTVLAYERFFLRLLGEGLVSLVIFACIKLQQNSSLAFPIQPSILGSALRVRVLCLSQNKISYWVYSWY